MPCSICGKTGHNIRTHFNKMLNHIKENKKGIDEITNSIASVSISGYRTDGSSHSNGIKAEKETVNYFNNNINNSNIVTRIRKSFDDDKFYDLQLDMTNSVDWPVFAFSVKKKDKRFIIHALNGGKFFDKIDKCEKKKEIIVKDLTENFLNQ